MVSFSNSVKKHEDKKQNPQEYICDVCGAPNALVRTVTDHETGDVVDLFSGFTCQKCIDAGKENEYVRMIMGQICSEHLEYNTLVDELEKQNSKTNGTPDAEYVKEITSRLNELDKNMKVMAKRAERYQRVILDEKSHFVNTYGRGVINENCSICGQKLSYLCVFEDHYEDRTEILDELSFWACADCNSNGRKETHSTKVLRDSLLFKKECADVKERYNFFMSKGKTLSPKEKKSFKSTFEVGKQLEEQEAEYKEKAARMKKARIEYKGIPIKTVIKTGEENDCCFLCGRIIGKNHVLGDD